MMNDDKLSTETGMSIATRATAQGGSEKEDKSTNRYTGSGPAELTAVPGN